MSSTIDKHIYTKGKIAGMSEILLAVSTRGLVNNDVSKEVVNLINDMMKEEESNLKKIEEESKKPTIS